MSLLDTIIAPQSILASFVVMTIGGLLFYPITSGTSWLYYFVLRRQRFFPHEDGQKQQQAEQRKKEWLWAVLNISGHAALTAPIHHLVVTGKSKVYFDVSDKGVPYLLLSIGLILLITEPLVYWAHRILHHPWLYKHIHLHHHQFRVPSPWTSMAFHPVDSFMQAIPHHICVFLFPVHAGVYLFFIVFLQVWSTFIHERVSWVRWSVINYTAHHTLHHKANKYNYGQFTTLPDRLFGTYRSPVGLVYDGADLSQPLPLGPKRIDVAASNEPASQPAQS